MRVVVALGGNALLRRGQPMTIENQRANVAEACEQLARLVEANQLVVSHGNGPQIGLLALEAEAYEEVPAYPLDVLGAESQGMLGYLLESGLRNQLPPGAPLATLLTMMEVDPHDPAFSSPTKPIGPIYQAAEAAELERERGWVFRPDGASMRRVVASPAPKRIVEQLEIRTLLDAGSLVICAGGGGVPVATQDGAIVGVEAVIDKDLASGLLARDVGAELFVMATDAANAFVGFGTPEQQAIEAANPDVLLAEYGGEFAAGSMLPKVTAACDFARATGRPAVIGQLSDIEALVAGTAGTRVDTHIDGVVMTSGNENKEH